MCDCALFRSLDFENSLTACICPHMSACAARCDVHEQAYKFITILIYRQMYRSKGPTSYLLLDDVLVDSVLSLTVILTVGVLRSGVERLLGESSFWVSLDVRLQRNKSYMRLLFTLTCLGVEWLRR